MCIHAGWIFVSSMFACMNFNAVSLFVHALLFFDFQGAQGLQHGVAPGWRARAWSQSVDKPWPSVCGVKWLLQCPSGKQELSSGMHRLHGGFCNLFVQGLESIVNMLLNLYYFLKWTIYKCNVLSTETTYFSR